MSLNFEHSFELRLEILRIFALMTRYIENVYNYVMSDICVYTLLILAGSAYSMGNNNGIIYCTLYWVCANKVKNLFNI